MLRLRKSSVDGAIVGDFPAESGLCLSQSGIDGLAIAGALHTLFREMFGLNPRFVSLVDPAFEVTPGGLAIHPPKADAR